jgi:hypothetical protein
MIQIGTKARLQCKWVKTPKIEQIFNKVENMVPEGWIAAIVQRKLIIHSYPRERPLWVYICLAPRQVNHWGKPCDNSSMGKPAAANVSTAFAKQGF